jgi:hypothetical protein
MRAMLSQIVYNLNDKFSESSLLRFSKKLRPMGKSHKGLERNLRASRVWKGKCFVGYMKQSFLDCFFCCLKERFYGLFY